MENGETSKQELILNAAIECVTRWGLDRFSMADLAKAAKVARSTVYMYYKTRDEVIRAALLQSAYSFGEKLLQFQARFDTPQERLIETIVYAVNALPQEPFLAMISSSALSDMVREHTLTTPEGMNIGTALIAELLGRQQTSAEELHEMSEFIIRFVLSLITMDSPLINNDDDLRGYVARRLLPSLGLQVPEQYQKG